MGLESSSEVVDVMLLLTACSFTLLVGIIIGYYVETFFRKYKVLGDNVANTAKIESQESWTDPYASVDSGSAAGVAPNVPHTNLKLQYMQRSNTAKENTVPSVSDAKALNSKPSKVRRAYYMSLIV